MPLFVFIGTHIPEVRQCLERLHAEATTDHTCLLWPQGFAFENPPQHLQCIPYENCAALELDKIPIEKEAVFLFLNPRKPLLNELGDLATHLKSPGIEPERIITCVDTLAASKSTALRTWLDAALFHSDVALLGNRSETPKTFLRDYQTGFQKRCFPTLFQLLKGKGIPENPVDLLVGDTRRLSLLFDLPETETEEAAPWVIESSCDLDAEEEPNDPFRSPDGEWVQLPSIEEHIVTETP